MSLKDQFNAALLVEVRAEEAARLLRVAAYKRTWNQERRAKNLEESRKREAEYMREWRAKNRERAREISRAGCRKYNESNPETRRKSSRDHNARRRAELMAFFGNVCVRCGFSDQRALHLDHIKGGGNEERVLGKHGLHDKWKMTRDTPEEARATFQLLCANCNNIKRDEDYEYSHRARVRKAAGL